MNIKVSGFLISSSVSQQSSWIILLLSSKMSQSNGSGSYKDMLGKDLD